MCKAFAVTVKVLLSSLSLFFHIFEAWFTILILNNPVSNLERGDEQATLRDGFSDGAMADV